MKTGLTVCVCNRKDFRSDRFPCRATRTFRIYCPLEKQQKGQRHQKLGERESSQKIEGNKNNQPNAGLQSKKGQRKGLKSLKYTLCGLCVSKKGNNKLGHVSFSLNPFDISGSKQNRTSDTRETTIMLNNTPFLCVQTSL